MCIHYGIKEYTISIRDVENTSPKGIKNMMNLINSLVEQGIKKVYVRELILDTDEFTEVSSSIHLSATSRDNYYLENEMGFKKDDYEIEITELSNILNYLTLISVNDTVIVTDKYAKENLENGKGSCFTKEELNWSIDNISHFYTLTSLYPLVKKIGEI